MSEPAGNVTEYSVSAISGALKRLVEDAFGRVRVRGEISGYRGPHSSGHAYFRLKDDKAALEAVIWKGVMGTLRFRPEEGMEVIATGKLTTFPGSSKYQIVIEQMEPAGAGALMALLEERRRRLAAEGLFDEARKQLLPFMPRHIGVVTSPTGAVIRDILHRVMDRFPARVTVWPVRVQGETTGAEVSSAITGFNAFTGSERPDVLIVARGGGSLEDLWGFNDEAIVRAVAASGIPVISAVGHETDWTLIDFAADVRAPTPTGAAEMAVPVKAELEATLASLSARLDGAVRRRTERARQAVAGAARGLPSLDALLAIPRRRLDEAGEILRRALELSVARKARRLAAISLNPAQLRQALLNRADRVAGLARRLDNAALRRTDAGRERVAQVARRLTPDTLTRRTTMQRERLAALAMRADRVFETRAERRRARLDQALRLMDSLSHKSVLKRGFALVRERREGPIITTPDAARAAACFVVEFAGGEVDAALAEAQPAQVKNPEPSAATKVKPPAKPAGNSANQGDLF
ncbi:MAG: exodeoxyribonuclease VII large subunit [Rhizobiaceae bacterium]|jgi:exodeoxyribonuclease VII large subunit|nr:exodeoxyribonuclease VII large subunit [Rhizobiaceae bacterium]